MRAGCRVVLTRDVENNERLRAELGEIAADVVSYPCIETEGLAPPSEFLARSFTGFVFVSPAAVRHFFDVVDPPPPEEVIAIGPGTAAAVRQHAPDWPEAKHAEVATADGVIAQIDRLVLSAGPILYVRGNLGDDRIPEAIRALGKRVEVLEMYRTNSAARKPLPNDDRPTAIVFASSSAVGNFVAYNPRLKDVDAIAIGPSTADAARKAGFHTENAPSADLHGLKTAITTWVARHHIN